MWRRVEMWGVMWLGTWRDSRGVEVSGVFGVGFEAGLGVGLLRGRPGAFETRRFLIIRGWRGRILRLFVSWESEITSWLSSPSLR